MRRIGALRAAAAVLLAAMTVSLVPVAASAEGEKTLPYTQINDGIRDREGVAVSSVTYKYDFSKTDIQNYSTDAALSTASLRTGMTFDGQTLSCVPGKTFSFGSSGFLGDDYGLYGGDMSFRMSLKGGALSAGVRLSKKAADNKHRGVWFTFDTSGITVTEPESKLSVSVAAAVSDAVITVSDKADRIELYTDGAPVCTVFYGGAAGALRVADASGATLMEKNATDVRAAGFCTLYADGLDGYVDDFCFEHKEVTTEPPPVQGYPIDYTTWIATDDLGRTTPTGVELRPGKQTGMFYFLSRGGEDTEFLQDNTRIYTEYGLDGLKEHLSDPKRGGGYFWAEPYFGYYRSADAWVIRKHAYQLNAAGIDFIFLDFTNGAYYPDALKLLLDTWLQIRREGGETPYICVFCAGKYDAVMGALRGSVYSDEGFEKYGELFYNYKGKPLLMAGVGDDDSELGRWCREKFTVRDCWAWRDEDGGWNWLQEYRKSGSKYLMINGGKGRDENGVFEELALCVGHHPTTSKGRSYANAKFPKVGDDLGFSLDSGAGTGLASQFDAIMYFDPDLILITGWNEWTAGLSHEPEGDTFAGSPSLGFKFVDQFNTEYSRDAEPMRMRTGDGVGFGDNYYYQIAGYMRTYKGTGAVSKATGQAAIDLTDKTAWESVGPLYGDNVGDTAWRSEEGYFTDHNYVNNTGRNDITGAKVSQDADCLYFTVSTARNIVTDGGRNWMNLFIDIDNDPSTGWEGFDLLLNRARDGHYVSVESLGNGWDGEQIGKALYTLDGRDMVIRLSKKVAGIEGTANALRFKWADNSTLSGNIMEFDDLGDAAPDGRFAYLYVFEGEADGQLAGYILLDANGNRMPEEDEMTPLRTTAQDNAGNAGRTAVKHVVLRYSAALKASIIAAGAVAGCCLFAVIALPTLIKRKKQNG